jgi:cysteinyl-tRNA synthetase
LLQELAGQEKSFAEAMEDDVNCAAAVGQVFAMIRLAGRVMEDKGLRKSQAGKELLERIGKDLAGYGDVLGVFKADPVRFLEDLRASKAKRKGIAADKVEELIAARQQARKDKDYAGSDRIRDELAGLSVEVKDTPAGPVWDVI